MVKIVRTYQGLLKMYRVLRKLIRLGKKEVRMYLNYVVGLMKVEKRRWK